MEGRTAIQHEVHDEAPAGAARRLALVRPDAGAPRAGVGARWIDALADRLMCRSSLVPTAPLLDVRAFDWTCDLRAHWQVVREEARGRADGTPVTALEFPATAALLTRIPGLHAARFELLPPGAHAGRHAAGARALLTCHLGLDVPRGGDLRMRLGERVVRWAQGETLLFDATRARAWWNDSVECGRVLAIEVRRPMCQPGRWIADRLLR